MRSLDPQFLVIDAFSFRVRSVAFPVLSDGGQPAWPLTASYRADTFAVATHAANGGTVVTLYHAS